MPKIQTTPQVWYLSTAGDSIESCTGVLTEVLHEHLDIEF